AAGASEQNGAPEMPSQVEDAPQSEDAVAVAASEQVAEDTQAESQALDDVPNDGTESTQPAPQVYLHIQSQLYVFD
ncbi:hypothetical protein, partial [Pantoea sp. GbtcB22]|uniref:hypothetical protein n=1 Tax=Pantoea sp. GbtcB22 TaxID=2824767 RepID=UPI001C30427E